MQDERLAPTAFNHPINQCTSQYVSQSINQPANKLTNQSLAVDGVQAFQTAEELEAEDSWFCSKCKRRVQANKKLDLWAVPEVLVVHLKRFFFTRTRRDKLDVQVEFPLENWDLSDVLPHHQVSLFPESLFFGLTSYVCHCCIRCRGMSFLQVVVLFA